MYEEDGCVFYSVNLSLGDITQKGMSKVSPIRKVEAVRDGDLFFKKLFPLLNSNFVCNGKFSPVLFPIKYINERFADIRKKEEEERIRKSEKKEGQINDNEQNC